MTVFEFKNEPANFKEMQSDCAYSEYDFLMDSDYEEEEKFICLHKENQGLCSEEACPLETKGDNLSDLIKGKL